MKRLLFVVHRYYPFPGGSEYNVQRLAEEAVRQGHDVTVLSDRFEGNLVNGVKVTGQHDIALKESWDAIFVHGSCNTQDFVHFYAPEINQKSPVYYLLVQPKDIYPVHRGLEYHQWIGCGTSADWAFLKQHDRMDKGRSFHYGLPREIDYNPQFRERHGITTTTMYLSVGGFWPHKGMDELAKAFREAAPPDTTLVLMGYDTQHPAPKSGDGVVCISGAPSDEVYSAFSEADLYVMNSTDEGFGLVLLESMLFSVPWIARPVAAGKDFGELGLGITYDTYDDLVWQLKHHDTNPERVKLAYEYVTGSHMIDHSLNDILRVLE